MYALFEYKGKQYKAEKGLEILVDKLDTNEDKIVIETVLLISNEGNVKVGTPYVSGCQIVAKKGNDIRDKKVLVYKEKSKKNYHKLKGHRQPYTSIVIEDIVGA
ncbi:MAG: 50S ribosomal protein L21 [Treponema sp.]